MNDLKNFNILQIKKSIDKITRSKFTLMKVYLINLETNYLEKYSIDKN